MTPARQVLNGACARCGREGDVLAPTRQVVSKSFTAMDHWRDPSGAGLCPPCAWAYRTVALRSSIHRIDRSPASLTVLDRSAALSELTAGLHPAVALIVPSRPGRKHLLPHARWGMVTLDDTPLSWTADDAARLGLVGNLRRVHRIPATAFAADSPPGRLVAGCSASARVAILTSWERLGPWRETLLWMTLALTVT